MKDFSMASADMITQDVLSNFRLLGFGAPLDSRVMKVSFTDAWHSDVLSVEFTEVADPANMTIDILTKQSEDFFDKVITLVLYNGVLEEIRRDSYRIVKILAVRRVFSLSKSSTVELQVQTAKR